MKKKCEKEKLIQTKLSDDKIENNLEYVTNQTSVSKLKNKLKKLIFLHL